MIDTPVLSTSPGFELVLPPAGSALWRRDFLFGAATAAFQIEGATQIDGRVPSIWGRIASVTIPWPSSATAKWTSSWS